MKFCVKYAIFIKQEMNSMHITGIIAEYNPFHNGHRYHIDETKKRTRCDILICVMSPHFVQRGEPAICGKWQRAETAIRNGCDIVIELPFPYALQSAKWFAQGAVRSLQLAGVNDIVFGSEIDDIQTLKRICLIDETDYQDLMAQGLSPVKAYEALYGTMNANDILGLNYIKAMKDTQIQPLSIKRTTSYHDLSLTGNIASATAIRNAFYKGECIDHVTCMASHLSHEHQMNRYYPLIQHLLLTLSPSYLSTLFMMDEGIEHHLIKQAKKYHNYDDFLHACVCRRYTASRIRRTLIHLITQTTKEDINRLPPLDHVRLLAYNAKGKAYLKDKKHDIKIASRFNQIPEAYRKMEWKATQTYAYPLPPQDNAAMMQSELQPPIYVS